MGIYGGYKRIKYRNVKPKKLMKQYQRRNERLSDLGYLGYKDYLKSEDWQVIRQRKLARFPNCLLCSKPANQVHHLSYSDEVLLGLEPRLLVTLCEECHEGIEFDGKRKRSLSEANRFLRKTAFDLGLIRWLNSLPAAGTHKKNKKRKPK